MRGEMEAVKQLRERISKSAAAGMKPETHTDPDPDDVLDVAGIIEEVLTVRQDMPEVSISLFLCSTARNNAAELQ